MNRDYGTEKTNNLGTSVDKTNCKKNTYNFDNMSYNEPILSNGQTDHTQTDSDEEETYQTNWISNDVNNNNEDDWNGYGNENDEENDGDNEEFDINKEMEGNETFSSLNLPDELVRVLMKHGLEYTTPCQKLSKHLQTVKNKFVAIDAKTGQGKTILGFLLAIFYIFNIAIEEVDDESGEVITGSDLRDVRECQTVILTCTRTLALQFYENIEPFCTDLGISIAMHRGTFKESTGDQMHDRTENINCMTNVPTLYREGKINKRDAIPGKEQIVIGTQGRLIQLSRDEYFHDKYGKRVGIGLITDIGKNRMMKPIDYSNVQTVIIDEADSYIDKVAKEEQNNGNGFTFNDLIESFKTKVLDDETGETLVIEPESFYMMSATIENSPDFFNNMMRMGCPIHPRARFFVPDAQDNIQREYVTVSSEKDKIEKLSKILKEDISGACLIFFNTKEKCRLVYQLLENSGYPVAINAGDISVSETDQILRDFKNGSIRFLCASGGTSRGTDIPTLQYVINYDIPNNDETFLHQIGRCARYTRSGRAISFVVHNGSNSIPPRISALSKKCGYPIRQIVVEVD